MKELNKKEMLIYLASYFLNFPLKPPDFINFGLTHRCNLRCNICETWEENPNVKEELTLNELKNVIKEIGDWDKKINISFAGGEPLIRKDDLVECIRYAKSLGLTTHLTTNGTLINKKVAEELVDCGLDYLQISLDSLNRNINDYIRDKGAYEKAMKATKIILKILKKKRNNLKFSFTTVITDKNLDDILRIYWFVKKNGMHEVSYNPFNIDTSYFKNKSYENPFWVSEKNLNKLKRICKKLIKLKNKGGKIGTPSIFLELIPKYFKEKEKFRDGFCMAGYAYMYIKPNGDVDVCGKGPSLNVRKYSIKKIWYSLAFFKTRLLIRKCKRPCLMLCFPRIRIRDLIG